MRIALSGTVRRARPRSAPAIGLTLALAVSAAGCGAGAAIGPSHGRSAPAHAAAPIPTPSTRPPTPSTVPATTTTTEQPGWTAVTTVGAAVAVDERSVVGADGSQVQLVRFRAGQVHFALHVGSADPPLGGVTLPADALSSVSPGELPSLVGAFNGGFESSTHAGGFEVDGNVLAPLEPGLGSFVVDASGSARVGVWGSTVPTPGEQVVSVRQNLAPLVVGGSPVPAAGSPSVWGATLGGGSVVARSAVGEDAAGDIVYAGSMAAVPSDLAAALVGVGVTTAMELDINPEWVQADVAPTPGAPLEAAVPGQHRPANQYLAGWSRDFVAVTAIH